MIKKDIMRLLPAVVIIAIILGSGYLLIADASTEVPDQARIQTSNVE